MNDKTIKKVIVSAGVIAAVLVLTVVVKFFMIDPANENDRLLEVVSKNESELASLRQQLQNGNGNNAELNETVSRLNGELASLREELARLEGESGALLSSQAADYEERLNAVKAQVEELKALNLEANDELESTVSRLDEAEASMSMLQSALDAVIASKNTAYTQLLSTYSTSFSYADAGRVTNLTIASRSITGTIVMPGETFSFFDVVGECTVPKGYQESKIFLQGEISEGLGGGICQISSTLYNAALLSGMKITERHNHSMKVSYLSPGLDATVSYGYMDLKFVNPYDNPVKIIATVESGKVTFSFYGEYKRVKVPEISINVTVNDAGDYVMERTVAGKVDYKTVSHYTK